MRRRILCYYERILRGYRRMRPGTRPGSIVPRGRARARNGRSPRVDAYRVRAPPRRRAGTPGAGHHPTPPVLPSSSSSSWFHRAAAVTAAAAVAQYRSITSNVDRTAHDHDNINIIFHVTINKS